MRLPCGWTSRGIVAPESTRRGGRGPPQSGMDRCRGVEDWEPAYQNECTYNGA